jgi:VWFA-related protein
MMIRPVRAVVGLMVAGICLVVEPAAQEPSAPSSQAPLIFRSGIDSISVDVIVTDRQGRPVTDLTVNDFEVREEGKPQAIETFKLVKVLDDPETPEPTRDIRSSADQARELAREDNRVFVIFLDDYHTRLQNSWQVRERLAAFVLGLTPRDIVALTAPLLPASALTFTRNHEATAQRIMSFTGRKFNYTPMHPIEQRYSHEPPAVQERMRNTWTISSLRALCEYMGSLRTGRKTLLYVSEGMSNTFPAGAETTGGFTMPTPRGNNGIEGPPVGSDLSSLQRIESMELVTALQSRVFSVANRSNTAIYTLDPRGLANFEYSVNDSVSLGMDKQILTQTTDVLRSIADSTDGRYIVNRNDPLPALQQMVLDNSAYYLLGYTSAAAFRDGKFHEIQVRVKRRDVEVRARKGYWAISPDEVERAAAAAKPPVPDDVSTALGVLASAASSASRQPVSLWLGARRGPAEKALVTLVWEAGMDGAAPSDRVDVDHVTVTAEGSQGQTLFTGRVDPDPQAAQPAGRVAFEAPPGSVKVRVDVANATGRRIETSDVTIDVPDFSSTAAQITTPVIFRGRTARDLQQVRALDAPLPTTRRTFARAERVLFRFDAYGPGGSTPTLTMRVLNSQGAPMASMPAPTRANGPTFESEFSLSAFPPGEYLIEIVANAGSEATKKLVAIRISG